jgi:DNA-binding response OmpR family regulator
MFSSRVLVVDDHEPFRRLVLSILEQRPEYQVVGQAVDGADAIRQAAEHQPDLVILDIGLPERCGIQVSRHISHLPVVPKILFLSQESSSEVVTEAMQSGALGYVHKLRANCDLLPAIESVLKGEIYVSSSLVFSMCVGCVLNLTNYHKAKSEWNEIRLQLRAAAELENDMFQRLLARWKILSAECQEHRNLYFAHVRGHRIA